MLLSASFLLLTTSILAAPSPQEQRDYTPCPSGLYRNPQCCTETILGIEGIECNKLTSNPSSRDDFEGICKWRTVGSVLCSAYCRANHIMRVTTMRSSYELFAHNTIALISLIILYPRRCGPWESDSFLQLSPLVSWKRMYKYPQ
jgi:hypothetical protein